MTPVESSIANEKLAQVGLGVDLGALAFPFITLGSEGGAMLFVQVEPTTYKITLGFDLEARGLAAKDDINAGFAWIFENTKAELVFGTIDADNSACLAMATHTYGYELQPRGETVRYEVTRERWQAARPK